MSLIWGSRTYLSKVQGYEAAIQEARNIIKNRIANNGQNIVVVAECLLVYRDPLILRVVTI